MSSEVATAAAVPTEFALIIGAMKSGTTSLFELLAQHPEIADASVKEPNFFSDATIYEKGTDWYRQLWDWHPGVHRIALEASPAYATFPARPGVPDRIARMEDAEFRFIYLLRNPLDQIESTVRHTLYAGWGKSLDEGIPEWMVHNVRYATQLEEYLKVFPADRFLLLTLEEFAQRPAPVLRRICTFLGVDPAFRFSGLDERYNSGDAYEMSRVWATLVRSPLARALAKRALSRSMRHRLRATLARLPGRNRELGRYELTREERQTVVDRLSEELRRLEADYGVPTQRYWSMHNGRLTI